MSARRSAWAMGVASSAATNSAAAPEMRWWMERCKGMVSLCRNKNRAVRRGTRQRLRLGQCRGKALPQIGDQVLRVFHAHMQAQHGTGGRPGRGRTRAAGMDHVDQAFVAAPARTDAEQPQA